MREKITDPAYSGWFLPFSKKPSNGTKWHMSKCTGSKCSDLYHDQEQTPHARGSSPTAPTRTKLSDGWYVYNNTNDVSGCHPGWETIVQGKPQKDWQGCKAAAEKLGKKGFTWWYDPTKPEQPPFCWCLDQWVGTTPQNHKRPGGEKNHASGYKPSAGEKPPPSAGHGPGSAQLCASGECDCGNGFPCGEYLWDHRNQSLRTWLLNEFILGKKTGLGNENVDGFFLDDGWTNKSAKVPPWAPPSYAQCSMSPVGGATEEDYFCTADMGLSQQDVNEIRGNWSQTIAEVHATALKAGGFTWPQFVQNGLYSLDLKDPRKTCATDMRQRCKPGNRWHGGALMYEFTRKLFHDPFPLPYILEDVAMFLLVRGKFAWLGFSWMGCNTAQVAKYLRPPALDEDYGEPTDELCKETKANSGVFVREWSKASVRMDCNAFKATITKK